MSVEENKKSFSKDIANILMNIPSAQREWVTINMPAEIFGKLCAFYDGKTIKAKLEYYMAHPEDYQKLMLIYNGN